MRMTRLIALAVPVAFILLNFAMPASAMKPEVTETTAQNLEGVWIDCSIVKPEWAFQVLWKGDERERIVTYFDNNGDVDHITYNEHWQEIAWNSVTGLTVTDNENWHETYYPATNTWFVAGHYVHWVIPGHGLVLTETGHSTWYWDGTTWLPLKELHGPHDLSDPYWIDLKPMCAALA